MRVVVTGLLLTGLVASAGELSPPPPPPSVVPEPMLPPPPDGTPTARGFTGAFTNRVSFFSTDRSRRYDVSLDGGRRRCKTPCALPADVGPLEVTTTRNGYSLTQELFVHPGENQFAVRPYSLAMVTTGTVLMGLSATALVVAAVFMGIAPYLALTWLLFIITPAVVVGIPGVVLTAVGANRHSVRPRPGPEPFTAP